MDKSDLGKIIEKQRQIFNNLSESPVKSISAESIKKETPTKKSPLKKKILLKEKNLKSCSYIIFKPDKKGGIYKCRLCLDSFPSGEILEHLKSHSHLKELERITYDSSLKKDGKLFCVLCNKSYSNKHWYLRHYMKLHNDQKADKKVNNGVLKKPKVEQLSPKPKLPLTKTKKLAKQSESHLICLTETVKGEKKKLFQCNICKKITKSKADMIKHIRVHTGERPYKCTQCDASFIQVTALRSHEKIHSGEKDFTCDVCAKSFAIKDRLRLHMRIHTGEKPYKCETCQASFARRSQVSQHARSHTKECFACDECDAKFASYTTLKSHLNRHKGIKEFQCPACGKKFQRIELMAKHIRTVHNGNKPYTCNICGKAFKGHLQQHLRLHMGIRPYNCHICSASFTQNSQLTVHIRIHTGERPYKCQICGSAFAHSSACKIHMRSHTGERPFSCLLCAHSFSQLPHLKKHMRCVHNAEKPYLCTICTKFFQTQGEIEYHQKLEHDYTKTPAEEAKETMEECMLAKMRNRLAVLLYRISSEDRREKFGFGRRLVDEVLKLSLEYSGHTPITDASLTPLEEIRQNVFLLLRWTIPKETMDEYHKNGMTVDEVLDMLTC